MKKVILVGASACLLAVATLPVRAAVVVSESMATWGTSPPQNVGNTTWDLISHSSALDGFTVTLGDFTSGGAGMLLQANTSTPVGGPQTDSLEYSVSVGTLGIASAIIDVGLDSTAAGGVTVTKRVYTSDPSGGATPIATLTSVNGVPDFHSFLPSEYQKLWIVEDITIGSSGELLSFQNTFNAVPEPTTMIAGALLLLPFGASTLKVLRKNRTV